MATTVSPVSPSTWKEHSRSHSQSSSRSTRPLATPRSNLAVSTSTTVAKTPLSPRTVRSPHTGIGKDMKSPSPSYFGFVVGEDQHIPGESASGLHVRQNWQEGKPASKSSGGDGNAEIDLFRRQSDKNITFALNNLPHAQKASPDASSQRPNQSPISPTAANVNNVEEEDDHANTLRLQSPSNPFFLGLQRHDSPLSLSPRSSMADAHQARLSLPAHEIQRSLESLKTQRSDTLPPQLSTKEVHAMVAPQEAARIITNFSDKIVVLDLRVYPHYAASRIRGALNLCIPTTLLKRPAFTVQKLADSLVSEQDRNIFNSWKTAQYIVVYDASSSLAKEAITSFTVLKKFVTEGWKGSGLVVKGGFAALQKLTPQLIDRGNRLTDKPRDGPASSFTSSTQPKIPVAGGCQMPVTKNAANPFFGNIRQNMDLLDGVGQLPVKKPAGMSDAEERRLPPWLRRAALTSDEGKEVSNKFLELEKSEQRRMQKALSCNVSYGTPAVEKANDFQVAGIEKGSKNRYNNIFPFEHSRVKLQGVPSHGCDYVNASFVKARYSHRRYIATQAPIPQTFDDFWKVTWDQDVRVIVMLTAESEGGQVKSHPYWKTGQYGPVKVKSVSEKKVLLNKTGHMGLVAPRKTTSGRRLTTSNATPAVEKRFNFDPIDVKAPAKKQESEEEPAATIRSFTISHVSTQSSQPTPQEREIVQIQYTQWPDFGAPASPTAILSLIDIVDRYQPNPSSSNSGDARRQPARHRQTPIMVHCSAGCGRTGTFCTIDSVIDMLKRQRLERQRSGDEMDVDTEDDWVNRGDIDLVAKAVGDLRQQRLSMVQNLRQFVLCYESILQWLHEQESR